MIYVYYYNRKCTVYKYNEREKKICKATVRASGDELSDKQRLTKFKKRSQTDH